MLCRRSPKTNSRSSSPDSMIDNNFKKSRKGHRRVDTSGRVTFKRQPFETLGKRLQKGVKQILIQNNNRKESERDLLMTDFEEVFSEEIFYPSNSKFKFKAQAPYAFEKFREKYGISSKEFLKMFTKEPLIPLSNPGQSGSLFWKTNDDQLIIKTIDSVEATVMTQLLPGYFMNVFQHPRTLLPKFYGMYVIETLGKTIRFIVMNNVVPQQCEITKKFDLKGSSLGRFASNKEKSKKIPTWKDLDWENRQPGGLYLEPNVYDRVLNGLERDSTVLQSFKIMDYSLLLVIGEISDEEIQNSKLVEMKSIEETIKKFKYQSTLSCIMRSNDELALEIMKNESNTGGIIAYTAEGKRVIVFMGIIDILQYYRFYKRAENWWKSIIYDGMTVSVCNPKMYKKRFMKFARKKVFHKIENSRFQSKLNGKDGQFRCS